MLQSIFERRWSILLGLLVFTYIFDSSAPTTLPFEIVSRAIYIIIFLGTILAAGLPMKVSRLGIVAVMIWPIVSLLSAMSKLHILNLLDLLFTTSLLVGILMIVFYELSKENYTRSDTVYGSIYGFLLIAFVFALFYIQIETFQPGSFDFVHQQSIVSALFYFSLVTITTLGYGDITPLSQLARVVAGLEAAIGVMYVAIFIGKIVGRVRTS